MKKLVTGLLVLGSISSFAIECKVQFKAMNPNTGAEAKVMHDFKYGESWPDKLGSVMQWSKFSHNYIWDVSSKEDCVEHVDWLVDKQLGQDSFKYLAYTYDGEKVVLTDKKVRCHSIKVQNQRRTLFGNRASSCSIEDKMDAAYRVEFGRY